MKLLITGASGMLGHSLMRLAVERHEVVGIYRSFPVSMRGGKSLALDLADEDRVKKQVAALKPEAIVHTAAMTDVEECERDPVRANRVNFQATKNLARLGGGLGIPFVYISTDYVFDGKKGSYVETDPPNPVNVYGETKLLGEEAVRSCCPRSLVIRTSIFGFNIQPKTGFVEYVMESLAKGEVITRFLDQFSTPIYTRDLGRFILELLDRGSTGLFHVGGGERISRYDFAVKVAETFCLSPAMIRPAPFRHLEGSAQRPRDSSLCSEKVESHLKMRLPSAKEGLERLKQDLAVHQKSEGDI